MQLRDTQFKPLPKQLSEPLRRHNEAILAKTPFEQYLNGQKMAIEGLVRKSALAVWDIGDRLNDIAERFNQESPNRQQGRIAFNRWFKESLGMSADTAIRYRRIARTFTREQMQDDRFTVGALAMLSEPLQGGEDNKELVAQAREKALRLVECGERIDEVRAVNLIEDSKHGRESTEFYHRRKDAVDRFHIKQPIRHAVRSLYLQHEESEIVAVLEALQEQECFQAAIEWRRWRREETQAG